MSYTVAEFINMLKALPQDSFLNFDVQDKYMKEVQLEINEEQVNVYPNNVWITFDLDDDAALDIY